MGFLQHPSAAPGNIGVVLSSLEWGWEHQGGMCFNGSYWRFLTWCVSPKGVSQGCVGPKEPDELLPWSESHGHSPALLLPDQSITVVRVPRFSFTSIASESLKQAQEK